MKAVKNRSGQRQGHKSGQKGNTAQQDATILGAHFNKVDCIRGALCLNFRRSRGNAAQTEKWATGTP